MGSTYKGDSPGKAVTRVRMWGNVIRMQQLLDIPLKGVVVLAGEGGDIEYLKTVVDPHNIHAVDVDKEALNEVVRKHKVPTYHGEVGAISKGLTYNIAHLDFCGRLSVDTINTVVEVGNNISGGKGFLSITLLKGREAVGGLKRKLWGNMSRQMRRGALAYYRKRNTGSSSLAFAEHILSLKDGEHFNPKYLLQIEEKRYRECWGGETYVKPPNHNEGIFGMWPNGKLGPLAMALVRMSVLRICYEILTFAKGYSDDPWFHVGSTWCYHSKTDKDHGTPFFTSVAAVGFRVPKIVILKEGRFDVSDAARSLQQLKNVVCHADYPAEQLAKIFKLEKGTVVAWKAHYSRGTYTFDEKPVLHIGPPSKIIPGQREGETFGFRSSQGDGSTTFAFEHANPMLSWKDEDMDALLDARRKVSNM